MSPLLAAIAEAVILLCRDHDMPSTANKVEQAYHEALEGTQ